MKLRSVVALMGTLATAGASSAGAVELKVGQSFPNMALPRLQDGRPASISNFRGHRLILHIFASW